MCTCVYAHVCVYVHVCVCECSYQYACNKDSSIITCDVVWQHYQNILSHELQSYRMVPGTLSVVVSDKVFFAGGYQGDKVFTGSITVAFVTDIDVSGLCTCDQPTRINDETI